MKRLYIARVILAVAFLVAAILCFTTGYSQRSAILAGTRHLHIMPLYFAESAGVIAVWLVITLVWGRIYCSTVCPVGTLQDMMLLIRRRIPALNRPFRYRHPQPARWHVLVVYMICLVAGLAVLPLILEPWFITGNIVTLFGGRGMSQIWLSYGFSSLWGVICGLLSLLVLLPWALLRGREFCNSVCPVGTVLGTVSRHAAFRIEIDGDRCVSCMRCQDNCRTGSIKVVSRYVDNGRCVRCMECVSRCPSSAIRYTQDRRRPATPLFSRRQYNKT